MADATLKIVIDALNKGDKTIKQLKDDLKGVEGSGNKANVVMGQLKNMLGVAGVTGAVLAVGNAVKQSITDWSAYAESIEKSARLSGVGTEEMSRLVQAADDFRVSQGSLETAMKMALKNGFVPTIDNLADLSDQFVALKDPADKAELASKLFGRQWAEIEPLLSQGGAAIRDGTAAIADNLVVTQKSVAQNKEFIRMLDDYQDALQGVKNEAGKTFLPMATDMLEAINNGENLYEFLARIHREAKESTPAIEAYSDRLTAQAEAYRLATDAANAHTDATVEVVDATNNADAAMRKYSEALLFSLASEGLSSEAALALAQRMGLVDEKTVEATEKTGDYKRMLDEGAISLETYNALVAGLASHLAELQDKTITVTYNQVVTGTAPGGEWKATPVSGDTSFEARASGGPVMAGMPYWVGERGPELVMPKTSGQVISTEDLRELFSGANGKIEINVYGADDPQRTANLIGINFRAAQALAGGA